MAKTRCIINGKQKIPHWWGFLFVAYWVDLSKDINMIAYLSGPIENAHNDKSISQKSTYLTQFLS